MTDRLDFAAPGSISRRSFVAAAAPVAAALIGAPAVLTRRADHDLIIRGGMLFDGTGAPERVADLTITGSRVVAVGAATARAKEEIDARGLAVAPGFIDIHSHVDGSLDADPRAESAIRQGITSIVAGQDGDSRATGAPESSFADMFRSVEQLRPAVNVASMVGYGSIRGAVVGEKDQPATPAQLAQMVSMVESALAQGACGGSSGLEYTPGAFASLDELIALSRPLAARRLPYATHMRNEDDRVVEAVDEAIAVARGAGCPLEISHLKAEGPRNFSKLDTIFQRIATARRAGLDVTFDRYPWLAYSTGLTNLFPVWSRDGGTDAFLARLDDPAVAPKIRQATLDKVALIGGWDDVEITSLPAAEDSAAVGQRLGTYARTQAADPYELTVAMMRRNHARIGMVGFAMSEENLERLLKHPLMMVCTDGGGFAVDGPTHHGSPHPRGIGSYPMILGRYVREKKVLTLREAIPKMTSRVAARLRLRNRGTLKPGFAADVVVFDPATVANAATYEDPFQYPVGIATVVVNGVVALHDGSRRTVMTGMALRV